MNEDSEADSAIAGGMALVGLLTGKITRSKNPPTHSSPNVDKQSK